MYDLINTSSLPVIWLSALWRACWQGSVAILLVWAVTLCWRRMPPLAQVWLWRAAFLKPFFVLCWAGAITLAILPRSLAVSAPPASFDAQLRPSSSVNQTLPDNHSNSSVDFQPINATPASATPAAQDHFSWRRSVTALVQGMTSWLPWLGVVWIILVVWGCAMLASSWWQTLQLLRTCRRVEDAGVLAMLAELSQRAGLLWPPELHVSEVSGPMLITALSPTIILPALLIEAVDAESLRLILAHEVAHIRQHDLRWCWVALLTQILFFFNPLAYLCVRKCQYAQEMAADALAVKVTEVPESVYGSMLVDTAARMSGVPQTPIMAIGVSESFRAIHGRLRAMAAWQSLSRRQLWITGGTVALFCLFALLPWRLAAQPLPVSATLEVQPYIEVSYKLKTPLAYDTLVVDKQVMLAQALVGNGALFDVDTLRVAVQPDSVTVCAPARSEIQSTKYVSAVEHAMEQTFGAQGFVVDSGQPVYHPVTDAVLQHVIDIIQHRLSGAGINRVSLQACGNQQIALVASKGQVDRETLSALLVPANLEVRLLPTDDQVSEYFQQHPIIVTRNGKTLTDAEAIYGSYLVMTGDKLAPIYDVSPNNVGGAVTFTITNQQAQHRFAEITGHNLRRNLAMVIDGKIMSALVVQGRFDGNGMITGFTDLSAAKRMAAMLNAGALPAPITITSFQPESAK